MPVLEAKEIWFRYGKGSPWVLRAAALEVRPGEIVGLLGESGQGKSTLARVLAGYLRAEKGTVLLDGAPLPTKGFVPVQLVFQTPELAANPRWPIRSILTEGGVPIEEALEMSGLDPGVLDRYPHELSGGELQRVCLARVVCAKTRYVVADEITAMLDPVSQARLWRRLQSQAARRQIGILAISHDVELLRCICDRILDMKEINRQEKNHGA